jgi:hypothetical protein
MSCAIFFSSCILVTLKFIAGRQTCRPSRAEKGLKDWAIVAVCVCHNLAVLWREAVPDDDTAGGSGTVDNDNIDPDNQDPGSAFARREAGNNVRRRLMEQFCS